MAYAVLGMLAIETEPGTKSFSWPDADPVALPVPIQLITTQVRIKTLVILNWWGFVGDLQSKSPNLILMKKNLLFGLALMATLNLTGCATIFSGTKSQVRIGSGNVEGAKVYYNGMYMGEAPETIAVSKKALKKGDGVIEIRAEGHQTAKIKLESKAQIGWVIWTVLTIPTIIPPIVDLATGAINRATPHHVNWNLEKSNTVLNTGGQ